MAESYIVLNKIEINIQTVIYSFSFSDNLKQYFKNNKLIIHYHEIIESVPYSVNAVVFVCCVLPIVWLTDSVLKIKELDKSFYDCIPNVVKGYKKMYPDIDFRGRLEIDRIVDNTYTNNGKSALFYSGGVDSAQTLISHLDENPILISIWGSDIRYDNKEGWDGLYSVVMETSEKLELTASSIRSSFREFDNEVQLTNDFQILLGDNYWHGLKHSISLIGHVAPLAYIHGISKLYIASTYCDLYPPMKCASNPEVDSSVRFSGCSVLHDGYEYSRQDKIHNYLLFCEKEKKRFSLHVCWETQLGTNCCKCEKCYRTMMGILAENKDPVNYGFDGFISTYKDFEYCFVSQLENKFSITNLMCFYSEIQSVMKKNSSELSHSRYWKKLKWFLKVDFSDMKSIKMPYSFRIRIILSRFRFYQYLHEVKDTRKKN